MGGAEFHSRRQSTRNGEGLPETFLVVRELLNTGDWWLYTQAMEFANPEEKFVKCPLCGVQVAESAIQVCFICKEQCCEFCARLDFGRTFCSTRCRGFFFWGDGEVDGETSEKDS